MNGSNSDAVIQDLLEKKAQAKTNIKAWKIVEKDIDASIADIINPEAILREADKLEDGGSKSIEMHGAKFSVEAKKTVKWDSAKLQAVAAQMDWPTVSALFDITFKMKEKTFEASQGLMDPSVMNQIKDARAVTIGEPSIKKAELITE